MNEFDAAGRGADRMEVSRSAVESPVDALFNPVGEALSRREEVRIAGFGIHETRRHAARSGVQS